MNEGLVIGVIIFLALVVLSAIRNCEHKAGHPEVSPMVSVAGGIPFPAAYYRFKPTGKIFAFDANYCKGIDPVGWERVTQAEYNEQYKETNP